MRQNMHTPGPWIIESSGPQSQGEWGYWLIVGPNGTITSIGAANQRGPIDIESNKANADLIAAAPEMYAALQSAEESLATFIGVYGDRGDQSVLKQVQAALAKARR